ncbi:phage integrase [Marinobacterium rhizophilum]|uniref:Tyrosine-type recombinase/integrase n=1 Tax=Marinobacterium rhizophilum TaxID=420402 RepID=A0ABY5HP75_9GAMM|nr:tyrosine-type recombinase/integrase [Marinobacterium rhizophilum]UTW14236.1 tyrosine-type recombinase/integrase [Marinobacterium rhizophilum]
MTISKEGNNWKVDIRPDGHAGKRVIRRFRTKAEATRFEAHVIARAIENKPWNPKAIDSRRLSTLIEIWETEHSPTISSGWKYARILKSICEDLGDPVARQLTPMAISQWRSQRMKQTAVTTINQNLQALKGLFNWLSKRGHIDYPNPMQLIENIRTHESDRPFLSHEQIKTLLGYLPNHPHRDVATLIRVCLETGARWSEAQGLTRERIHPNRLIFTQTKSKKTRAVPINQELYDLILSNSGAPPFRHCETSARALLNSLLDLPKGISTHILRHTFASHFVMAGGNILTLQRILGHSSIQMTMRYAHLAPDHLEEATRLNPVSLGKNRESGTKAQ